ncbi:MAG TPA: hypothetical protein VGP13_02765 [Candidatus Paceibacterota bacterium]|jgi:hypothetical protein|nr:hypothetical protein [Candidatus Paceibacterota bacterium]
MSDETRDGKFAVQLYLSWPVYTGVEGVRTVTFAPFVTLVEAEQWAQKTSQTALKTLVIVHAPFRVLPLAELHPRTIVSPPGLPIMDGSILGILAFHEATRSRERAWAMFSAL